MILYMILSIICGAVGVYLIYQNHDYESRWDMENAKKMYYIGIALLSPLAIALILLLTGKAKIKKQRRTK